MLCISMKILSHASVKKTTKKADGFQILHFYGSFSSNLLAVKGLKTVARAGNHPF